MTDEELHAEREARLQDCLQQMIADGLMQGDAGMLTGFTCYVGFLDDDGAPSWATIYAPEQRTVQTAGHVMHLDELVRHAMRVNLAED